MFRITDLIVYVWCIPMTLFIITPLMMLCGWGIFKLVRAMLQIRKVMKPEHQFDERTFPTN